MPGIDYTPPPSLSRLFTEPKFFNVLVGPVGSTKTTACIMFLLLQALTQAPGPDGRRVTRYAISRETLVELRMTVMRDIQHLLGPLVKFRSTENLAVIDADIDGTRVFSEWFFIPLDRPEDERRLLSTAFSGVWINEVREVPFRLIIPAAGRCGRWPRQADGGCTFPFMLMDTNPPAIGSELWEFLEVSPPRNADGSSNICFIRQPSARSAEADWLQYLPPRYYENLVLGQTEEWVRVHVDGEYGRDPSGLAVFGETFSKPRHVSTVKLRPWRDRPLVIGLDPGLNPAAVAAQLDPDGRWLVLREGWGQASGTRRFLTETVLPWLAEPELQGLDAVIIVDPAASQREGLDATTALAEIRRFLPAQTAATNDVQVRVEALEDIMMGMTRKNEARLMIDGLRCPTLVRALQYEYVYRRRRDGQTRPLPEKTHPWSDLVDALGYVVSTWSGQGRRRWRRKSVDAMMAAQAPPFAAWV